MSSSNDLVSVILPAYNAERYVGEAIESVLRQGYPDFEIMIVDDASQDRTKDVVKSFNDKRINLITHSKNLGPGSSRNTAIDAARGRWIALLDADDQWHSDRLSKLVDMALLSGDHFFVSDDCMVCFNTSAGLKPWDSQLNLYHKVYYEEQILSLDLAGYFEIGCPGLKPLIPLNHIKKHRLAYDPNCRMGEDFEFYCNLFRTGLKLRLCRRPLYFYRLTPGSLSTNINRIEHQIGANKRLLEQDGFNDHERTLIEASFQNLRNRQAYEEFSAALKLGKFKRAAHMAVHKPGLVVKLLRRLPDSWRYRSAARRCKGALK